MLVGRQKKDLDLCDFLTFSFATLSATAVFSSILLLARTSWGEVPFPMPTTSLQVNERLHELCKCSGVADICKSRRKKKLI